MLKIDLGSGRATLPGYKTVDKEPMVGADFTADILELPFKDGEVDEVRAHHILEHLPADKSVAVMREIFRVLKPAGIADIEVPRFPHPASVQDPTHISFWNREKLGYFIKGDRFGEAFAKRHPSPLFELVEEWKKGPEQGPPETVWAVGVKFRKPL